MAQDRCLRSFNPEPTATVRPKHFNTAPKSARAATRRRIAGELARTSFGILCLTSLNLDNKWIHFEAGALAKQITDQVRVVPYLHGVSPSDLSPPLNMFNGVKAD